MQTRTPGALQGIMLLLPITMAVMGISVLTPVVHLMLAQIRRSRIPGHRRHSDHAGHLGIAVFADSGVDGGSLRAAQSARRVDARLRRRRRGADVSRATCTPSLSRESASVSANRSS
jgi:hypothetical protein